MTYRMNQKSWIIYPENLYKANYEMLMTLILLITCIVTPYNIAFTSDDEPVGMTIVSGVVDFLFFVEIFV
jgi:hypothetical protein